MGPLCGSGFIIQVIYSSQYSGGHSQNFDLLTENGDLILTESGGPIEIEH
jgi:hypothetical protein